MKILINFKCENSNCVKFNQKIEIEQPMLFDKTDCTECRNKGELQLIWHDQKFSSSESLINYSNGLIKELELLERLKNANIWTSDEENRYNWISTMLKNTKCPCCGNFLINKTKEK